VDIPGDKSADEERMAFGAGGDDPVSEVIPGPVAVNVAAVVLSICVSFAFTGDVIIADVDEEEEMEVVGG